METKVFVKVKHSLDTISENQYSFANYWVDCWDVGFLDLTETEMSQFLQMGYSLACPLDWAELDSSGTIRCADLDMCRMWNLPF